MKKLKRLILLWVSVTLLMSTLGLSTALALDLGKTSVLEAYKKSLFKMNPGDYAKWQWKGKTLTFSPKIENNDDQSIVAYTVDISCSDLYDEPIYTNDYDGTHLWFDIDQTIGAGKVKYAPYLSLEQFSSKKVKYVKIAVVKYRTADGVNHEMPAASYEYHNWTIK